MVQDRNYSCIGLNVGETILIKVACMQWCLDMKLTPKFSLVKSSSIRFNYTFLLESTGETSVDSTHLVMYRAGTIRHSESELAFRPSLLHTLILKILHSSLSHSSACFLKLWQLSLVSYTRGAWMVGCACHTQNTLTTVHRY